jgi:hypothetical protein
MEARQGYVKGMDQDASNNKRNPETYYEAHNFRFVTEDGSSAGVLENEKGTQIAFRVPDLDEMVLGDAGPGEDVNTTVIPAQAGLHIIGSTTMVDRLIIFTTATTSANPAGGYGQIWMMQFDEETGVIDGLLPGDWLDPNVHLMYNQQLEFSTDYRIGRAVALYENEKKQRVYWTDNYNPLRVFNLADDDPLNVPLDTVNVFPGSSLSQPVIKGLGNGNIPSGTTMQFTYKLINLNGGETTYAPPTVVYPLPNENTGYTAFGAFHGLDSSNSRSVEYEIKGLDTSYDAIQHIAIIYNAAGGLSNIWLFAEDSVPASGEIDVVCSTLSNATIIPLEEYSVINLGFDRCKDIEVQGNRLVAANIRTSTFGDDFDFDARAYRFNSSQECLLKDSNSPYATVTPNDITLNGPTPTWTNVPEEHDAINNYNDEGQNQWWSNHYKFQSDGTTIGGEGPNIKYKFIEFSDAGATWDTFLATPSNAPNHIKVGGYPTGTPPLNKGVLQADGSLQPVYRDNQTSSPAAPWIHANYRGYARGEVYRFGIVFYNKQSIPSFVQWIGDIKFPDVSDGYPLHDWIANASTVNLKQLGIEFEVDVSSIADQISGYSIVRLERRPQDRTRISTGYHMFFNSAWEFHWSSLIHRYWQGSVNGSYSVSNPEDKPYPVTGDMDYFGDTTTMFHCADRPGYPFGASTPDFSHYFTGFLISPLGNCTIGNIPPGDTDYLETLGYCSALLHNYYEPDNDAQSDANYAFYYKMKEWAYPNHGNERRQIHGAADVLPGAFLPSGGTFLGPVNFPGNIVNTSYARDNAFFTSNSREHHPLGIGNSKRIFTLKGTSASTQPTLPHMIGGGLNNPPYYEDPWNGLFGGPNALLTPTYYGPHKGIDLYWQAGARDCDQDVSFKLVGYRRYLTQQYAGNSYESRSTNEYSYIGHHQIMVDGAENLTFKVFGGDVTVNYMDFEYLERYNSQATQDPAIQYKPNDFNKIGIAVCGPVESVVNTNYRGRTIWAKDKNATDIDFYSQNSNTIYLGWNQMDEVQREFFAEDFLSQLVEEFPHQLWASDIKIYGELTDSWRSFPIANKIDVDGIYGPINRIMSFKDNLMFYQDRAVGIASLDERSVIQDDSGQELVLGTGGVFPDYKYLSTITGSVHQFDVVQTERAAYHFDARLRKLFQFQGGLKPISDIQGMSSFFDKNVVGIISVHDKTLRQQTEGQASGIHGTYDPRYNRVLFTFLNTKQAQALDEFFIPSIDVEGNKSGNYIFEEGDYIQVGTTTYYCTESITISSGNPPTSPSLGAYPDNFTIVPNSFTISYNETTQSFESFYDFKPGMYLEYGRRLLSVSPFNTNEMHTHNVGPYCTYYDQEPSKSIIHTKLGAMPEINKIFNNLAYMAELYDDNNQDIYNETFNRFRFFNNYQDTGTIDLTVNGNIKRRMRTWRAAIPRDSQEALSRMRNSWLDCILEYDNNNNKRLVLQDLMYSFTPTKL